MAEKVRKSSGRRELEELIQTCNSIENRRFNPFLLDVGEALRVIRLHSKSWQTLKDHLLDMRAITSLARVVGLQSAHLRFQSSSLFIDPEMVKKKVETMSREQLAEFLLLSWHPIIELEQLTLTSTKEALEFWDSMVSFFERRRRLQTGPFDVPGSADSSELSSLRIIEEKTFTKRLEEVWKEMKQKAGEQERTEYWTFVRTTSFAQTVLRAQMVSFLISYGMAALERKREKLFLIPKDAPFATKEGSPLSFPIPIPKEVVSPRAK